MVPCKEQILDMNHGNVFLAEKKDQSQVYLVPTSNPLPSNAMKKTHFDTNPWFQKAKKDKKSWACLLTPSHNVLVVPTTPYASIRDFCQRCTLQEYHTMWQCVMDVRYHLEQQYAGKFYIQTIGFDVPQLHIRIVRKSKATRPDNPAWLYDLI